MDVQACSAVTRKDKGEGNSALKKFMERSSDQIFMIQRFDLQNV